tara:strand:+ start:287 stop:436 length:150 start_codon:yes stop_codon:yes gene_type:complete
MKLMRQDKEQQACAAAFIESIRDGFDSSTPYDGMIESCRISIEIANKLN